HRLRLGSGRPGLLPRCGQRRAALDLRRAGADPGRGDGGGTAAALRQRRPVALRVRPVAPFPGLEVEGEGQDPRGTDGGEGRGILRKRRRHLRGGAELGAPGGPEFRLFDRSARGGVHSVARRETMGLFDGTKRRHLNDLEREVLANPTPQNMVSLIERYMAAGDEAKALEMARKAIEKFPNSEKAQTTYQNVRRLQLQAEITDISKALRRSPGKSLYERLASIYHSELGNRTKAFETALEGLAKFPQSDGLHLISGLI